MSAENPADTVIEAAATEIHIVICEDSLEECLSEWAGPCLKSARALHDAGLLADPADRDEPTDLDRFIEGISDPPYLQGYLQGYQNGYKHAEAERAEAERDEWEESANRLAIRATTAETERDAEYRKYAQEADRAETLEAEVADLRQKWLAFTSALGFGNNRTEPAAELSEMIDPIEQAFSDARDHQECAVICELCGDPLASKTCDECHGSGCLPNSALAYLECGTCAGAGKVHEGCVEKSYAELVAERDELRATIAALGGAGEQP